MGSSNKKELMLKKLLESQEHYINELETKIKELRDQIYNTQTNGGTSMMLENTLLSTLDIK